MFDFAWSEIAVIAGVALVVIGPKDLPVALRTVSGVIKKARRMAAEFQTHVDEMMKEADLKEVKDSINEIRNFDFKGTVEKTIDPDSSLRNTFTADPFAGADGSATPSEAAADETLPPPVEEPPGPVRVEAPAFIPLGFVPFVTEAEAAEPPPAFIPPSSHSGTGMLQRPPS
jgi:sec-independent protein translocase protein TatB